MIKGKDLHQGCEYGVGAWQKYKWLVPTTAAIPQFWPELKQNINHIENNNNYVNCIIFYKLHKYFDTSYLSLNFTDLSD